MALSAERLLGFLGEQLGVDTSDVDSSTPLFSSGLIDSGGMVELIVFVESEGGVQLAPEDISLDYLDSIDRILKLVGERA